VIKELAFGQILVTDATGGNLDINDSVVSQDGTLKVKLTAFDPARGKGQINVTEISQKRGWFYIIVKFRAGGQNRIEYKTWDVHKTSDYEISTIARGDSIDGVQIIRVPESSN
jgi:hypothetical protein